MIPDPVDLLSLQMTVELVDGEWVIEAEWLERPVKALTFFDAYWLARASLR